MKFPKRIIAISAGQDCYKKGINIIRKKIKFLNYGLLGLVTLVYQYFKCFICMFEADYRTPNEMLELIDKSDFRLNNCDYMLLSIPSCYSIQWCIEFCRIVKESYDIKIIAGGRWVVDGNVNWLKQKMNIDTYIEGFGEKRLIRELGGDDSQILDGYKHCFNMLDYTLLYNYHQYPPSIEISRGCGSKCSFCPDSHNKRLPNKDVDKMLHELKTLDTLYSKYSCYLEAPHFVFEPKWTQRLCSCLKEKNKQYILRCTTRVETLASVDIETLSNLASVGLKIIDVGLESASPVQLVRMSKTRNPEQYLEKADQLLEKCAKAGIWVKLNILLYAGETAQTIEETISWLKARRELIKDVSVSSLVYYKNMGNAINIYESYGAKRVNEESLESSGYVNFDLSPEISYEMAKEYMKDIPKLMANKKDFYDVKSLGYFSPEYSYQEFLKDIETLSSEELPFNLD